MPPLSVANGGAPQQQAPPGGVYGPDGKPYRSSSEMAVPPWITFAGIFTGAARTFFHRGHDEALRRSPEDALAMEMDPFLQGLLQERKLAASSLPWHLEVPDEKNPKERQVRDTLTKILKGTRGLRRIVWQQLDALWRGRSGSQMTYKWGSVDGLGALCVDRWAPVNGDKLGWQHDERGGPDVAYMLINAAREKELVGQGETVVTTIGGKGVLLKGGWRERYLLHRHEVKDADFFRGIEAGRIQGVGIRDGVYWLNWLRLEYLEWITTYLERVGMGVTIWNYDAGNPQALAAAQKAAREQDRRVSVFVPVWPDGKGGSTGGLERLETPVQGVEALKTLVESFCEKKIERFVIGQEASASSEGSKGLGNEAGAELQADTKQRITAQDALLLGESMTGDANEPGLLSVIQYWTFLKVDRALATLPVRWVFDVERAQSKDKLDAAKTLFDMGVSLKEDEVRAAAGFSKPGDDDAVVQQQPQAPPGMGPPGAPGEPGQLPPGHEPPGQPPGGQPSPPHRPPPGGPQAPAPKPPAVPHARDGSPARHADHDVSGEARDEGGKWTGGGGKGRKPPADDPVHSYLPAFASPSQGEAPATVKEARDANKELKGEGSKFRVVPDGKGGWEAAHVADLANEYGAGWVVTDNPLTGRPEVGDRAYFEQIKGLSGDREARSYLHAFNDTGQEKATAADAAGANAELARSGSPYRLHLDEGYGLWVARRADAPERHVRGGSPARHAQGAPLADPATYLDALEFLTKRGMGEAEALAELRRVAAETAGSPGTDPPELLALPNVRQEFDYDCGAAAAMAVGQFFEVGPDTLGEWRQALGTSESLSTSPQSIIRYLSGLGLEVTPRQGMTVADLRDAWRAGKPVLCPIQEYGLPSKAASYLYGHWIATVGVALGMVIVQDPSADNVLGRPGGSQGGKPDPDSLQAPGLSLIPVAAWERGWHDEDVYGAKFDHYGIVVGPPAGPSRYGKGDEDDPDDAETAAGLIADILHGLYGDKALDRLGGGNDHAKRYARTWNALEHPRGKNGRFIKRGSDEARAAAHEAVSRVVKGDDSPHGAEELMQHLNILTVKQLKEIHQQHGKPWQGPRREELVKGVLARLEAGQEGAGKPPATPQPGKVYNVATGQLLTDPGRFQYKLNVDSSGVTQELKGVKTFNPDFAGVISVWKDPADGKTYVVNGHHRYELADRLDHPNLAVRYVTAANAKEARAVGALINIAEGRGTAVDAAKFMRDMGVEAADMAGHGVSLKGKLAEDAVTLTKLSDGAFNRVTLGTLDQAKALAVAKHLTDHDRQDQLFRLLDKREDEGKDLSPKVIEEMAREMAETPTVTRTESGLFGDIESEESLFVPRNELKASVRADLSREVSDFLAVASKRRAGRVAEAGNVLDPEANKKIAQEAERVKNVYDTLVNRKGAISDALNTAAADYANAKSKRERDAIRTKAAESVRDAVFREAGVGREAKSAGGGGEADRDEPAGEPPAVPAQPGRGDTEPAGLTGKVTADSIREAAQKHADLLRAQRKKDVAEGRAAEDYRPGDTERLAQMEVANLARKHAADLSEDDFVKLLRHGENRKDMAQGNAVRLVQEVAGLRGKQGKDVAEKALAGIDPTRIGSAHFPGTPGVGNVFGQQTAGVTQKFGYLPAEDVYRAAHRLATGGGAELEAPPDLPDPATVPAGTERTTKDGTTWAKAPAGGATSPVNGKPYKGGQWMPIHGLSQPKEKPPTDQPASQGGPPPKPSEEGKGRERTPRAVMTPEQIEDERQRRHVQSQWDDVRSGPLGRMKSMGERPHRFNNAVLNLKPWKEYAESVGEEKLQGLVQKLEQLVRDSIQKEIESRGGTYEPADLEWAMDSAKRQAEQETGMFTGSKKHLQSVPSSFLARAMIQEITERGAVGNLHKVNELLAETEGKPSAAPASEHAALSAIQPGQAGHAGGWFVRRKGPDTWRVETERGNIEGNAAKVLGHIQQQNDQSRKLDRRRIEEAEARYRGGMQAPAAGTPSGLFGAEDTAGIEGFSRLPDGADIVVTEGGYAGRVGKVVKETDEAGRSRTLVKLDGTPERIPIRHSAVEPLDPKLSWRKPVAKAEGSQAKQGGLF